MPASNTFFLLHTLSIVSERVSHPILVLLLVAQYLYPSTLPYSIPHRSPTPPTPPGYRQQQIPTVPSTYPTLPFPGVRYVQQKAGRVFNMRMCYAAGYLSTLRPMSLLMPRNPYSARNSSRVHFLLFFRHLILRKERPTSQSGITKISTHWRGLLCSWLGSQCLPQGVRKV